MMMEAEKTQNLQSANGGTGKPMVWLQSKARRLQTQEKPRFLSKFENHKGSRTSSAFLFDSGF